MRNCASGWLSLQELYYYYYYYYWRREELQTLERKTEKLLNIHGQHHPKTEGGRLYVPRKQKGRGLMQLEKAYAA